MSQTLSDRCLRRVLRPRRGRAQRIAALAFIAFATALGLSSSASAFTQPTDFGKYPTKDLSSLGGGGGRYFTGSPADAYGCDVCHSNPDHYSFPLVQKGLPLDGYVPDTEYKIELSSPMASAATVQALNQNWKPLSTMLAEFIAEDGGPAGTVSFPSQAEMNTISFPALWCSGLSMALPGKEIDEYGMNIYSQEVGSLTTEITAANEKLSSCTVDRGKDETGEDYQRRCILALRPCGAQSIKFVWKSPSEWSGPIWFSAGFVTTYDRSAAPNDNDFATTLTIPLNPGYLGAKHETVLESGCSVAGGPSHNGPGGLGSRGAWLGVLWLLRFVFVRSRVRRLSDRSGGRLFFERASWACLLVVLAGLGVGCTDGDGFVTEVSGSVGAYENSACTKKCKPPIKCRKSAWSDAGTPELAAMARDKVAMGGAVTTAEASQSPLDVAAAGSVGAAGSTAGMGVRSLGTVDLEFASAQPAEMTSGWVKKCVVQPCWPNYVAVWIENDAGEFVQTLNEQKGDFIGLSLTNFLGLGSDCQVPTQKVDSVSGATLFAHKQYTLHWNGLLGSGHRAALPGTYVVKIEVSIDEALHIAVAEIPIQFGDPTPSMMMIPPAPAHAGVSITYTPTP